MNQPLFLDGFGEFAAVKVNAFAPRHALADIRGQRGEARDRMRRDKLEEVSATAEARLRFGRTSTLSLHAAVASSAPCLGNKGVGDLEAEPRVRFTLRLNRLSSVAPEIFYVAFPLPTHRLLPQVSSGGQTFTPFSDQLPGTCRDYFAIDGWADYATRDGRWLWVSRDAPLISFGTNPTLALREQPPADPHLLRAMIFNNFWYTNFAADEHGIMEFQFDLIWQEKAEGAARTSPTHW